jgi:hypothetical protein
MEQGGMMLIDIIYFIMKIASIALIFILAKKLLDSK